MPQSIGDAVMAAADQADDRITELEKEVEELEKDAARSSDEIQDLSAQLKSAEDEVSDLKREAK